MIKDNTIYISEVVIGNKENLFDFESWLEDEMEKHFLNTEVDIALVNARFNRIVTEVGFTIDQIPDRFYGPHFLDDFCQQNDFIYKVLMHGPLYFSD